MVVAGRERIDGYHNLPPNSLVHHYPPLTKLLPTSPLTTILHSSGSSQHPHPATIIIHSLNSSQHPHPLPSYTHQTPPTSPPTTILQTPPNIPTNYFPPFTKLLPTSPPTIILHLPNSSQHPHPLFLATGVSLHHKVPSYGTNIFYPVYLRGGKGGGEYLWAK